MIISDEIAECIGLWLAEGDSKCKNEITLSNNCFPLVVFFNNIIRGLFDGFDFNVRIYVYTPDGNQFQVPIEDCVVKWYVDRRATKPYYIWRLASVSLNKKWKDVVRRCMSDTSFYAAFLRGFFAGEGNIKLGSHNSRVVRIAQGKRLQQLEKILHYFGVEFRYRKKGRSYWISGKSNWDRLASIRIADLHPLRKKAFWEAYNSFKEEHYDKNYLKSTVFGMNKAFLLRSVI